MKYLFKIFFLFFFLINSFEVFSQELSQEEREILELKDRKILGENDKLIKYLLTSNLKLRIKSIYALANIEDTLNNEKLNLFLAGPMKNFPLVEDVKAVAFLFGQIQNQNSRDALEILINNGPLNVKDLISIRFEAINSLGKVGNEKDLEEVSSAYKISYVPNSVLMRAVAMSIARFGIRKIKNEKSIDALKYFVNNTKDIIALRNTAYAFWRIGDKNLLLNAKQEIYNLTKSKDAQTRMWAYNAIGKLQDKMFLRYMLESINSEKDWRVKVNMQNSMTNFKIDSLQDITKQVITVLEDAIKSDNEHLSLTGLNVIGKLFSDYKQSDSENIKLILLEVLNSPDKYTWRQRAEAANSLSLIFKVKVKNDLLKTFLNTDDYDLKTGIIKAFGNFNDGLVYKEIRDTVSAEVQRYNSRNSNTSGDLIGSNHLAKLYRTFVEMLSSLDDKVDAENQNIIRLIFTEFAGSKDLMLVDLSLTALKDSLYMKYRDETNSVLMFDYNELEYPKDYDVMLIFIDALKEIKNQNSVSLLENNLKSENHEIAKLSADALEKITGKKYEFTAKPRTDFDWDYIERLSQKKFVTVKTNKGDIKIELLSDVAPFTVMNFLKLAGKNFYDGTIFHRVVSNFVIQGGDPTGTGDGSPGYTIRSEFSPLTYERGMVGMASSGKDTEGSQFFITHSATPHLDGRYTIFGKVVDGMDVVDKIMIGDKIEDVVIQ